jgi:hypothetical protein
MKDIEVVMIGLGKAAEVMGCGQAQLLMNRMCTIIGEEIGKELKDRRVLNDDTGTEETIAIVSEFFGVKPTELNKTDKGVEIKYSQSKICPNLHIEKECPPICPFLGLLRGVGRSMNKVLKTSGVLDPTSICSITISEG